MKKKLIAWLILVLVVLQAFFVPVFAEGEEENVQYVEKSFSETSILQDFGVSSAAELKTLVGGSFGAGNSTKWEVLNAAYERVGNNYRFFLFLMRRASSYGISGVNKFDLVLTGSNSNGTGFLYVSSTVVSRADDYFIKLQFDLPGSSQYIQRSGSTFRIELYSLKPQNVNALQRGFITQYESGIAESSVGLIFNPDQRPVQSLDRAEELKLNVTMMSERYSCDEGLSEWKQLNTCAFIIPNSYFQRFGDLAVIRYVYDLYEDVPMLVLKKSSTVNAAYSHAVQTQRHYNSMPFTVQERYWHPVVGANAFREVDFCRYFIFPVDEIHNQEGDPYDFSSSEALSRFASAKSIFLSSNAGVFQSFLKASSSQYVNGSMTPDDTWSTLSFADYLDSQNWLVRLYYKLSVWGDFEDDSLDEVPAIQFVDSSLSGVSDDVIASTYLVDPVYSASLRSLSESAVSSDGTLVLFRFCLTDYKVTPISRLIYDGVTSDVSGYVCENAIIDNFEIINFDFKRVVMTPDGPEVIVTTVPVEMDPVTFIEGGQSGPSLVDGVVDSWETPFGFLKKSSGNAWDWIKRVVLIILAVVLVIVLYKAITLIVSIASIFKRRKDLSSDEPPKKKRRRLFGRRRE